MKLKPSDFIVVILLLLAVWNPPIPGFDRLTGPVSRVVVITETADTTPAIANVTGGATARAMRDAGKWKQWDKDSVPLGFQTLIDSAKSFPWCCVLHGNRATFAGPLPLTESEFAALIQKQGGIK